MSEEVKEQTVNEELKEKKINKKVLISVLVVAAVITGFFVHNSLKYQSTDDAYVETTTVQVAPRVSGQIIEVYIDDGAYSYSMERRPDLKNREGFHFWGNNIEVKEMEVYTFRSIWE